MPIIPCSFCQKKFSRKLSQLKSAKQSFCSEICQHKARKTGEIVKCFICGKEIYRERRFLNRSQTRKFFCSKKCCLLWHHSEYTQEKHPNWKTGKYSYRAILKKVEISPQCCKCGKNDLRILVVHHLDKNRDNNQKSNLVWLCHNCHHLVHHYIEKTW